MGPTVVDRVTSMLHSVGHRVKIHKVAPAVGNERDDVEIKDYVVFPPGQDNLLSSDYSSIVMYNFGVGHGGPYKSANLEGHQR